MQLRFFSALSLHAGIYILKVIQICRQHLIIIVALSFDLLKINPDLLGLLFSENGFLIEVRLFVRW